MLVLALIVGVGVVVFTVKQERQHARAQIDAVNAALDRAHTELAAERAVSHQLRNAVALAPYARRDRATRAAAARHRRPAQPHVVHPNKMRKEHRGEA